VAFYPQYQVGVVRFAEATTDDLRGPEPSLLSRIFSFAGGGCEKTKKLIHQAGVKIASKDGADALKLLTEARGSPAITENPPKRRRVDFLMILAKFWGAATKPEMARLGSAAQGELMTLITECEAESERDHELIAFCYLQRVINSGLTDNKDIGDLTHLLVQPAVPPYLKDIAVRLNS
jgi:hypothetical protein